MITRFKGKYRFLCNFYPCKIVYFDITYPSVEHAFQASKTWVRREQRKIAKAETAAKAKRMGRLVELKEEWEDIKEGIMLVLLRKKFRHKKLREKLLDTGIIYLIEGNTWGDKYWGVCGGEGLNKLGHLLMKVRHELLCES